jgi:hypothetical protein
MQIVDVQWTTTGHKTRTRGMMPLPVSRPTLVVVVVVVVAVVVDAEAATSSPDPTATRCGASPLGSYAWSRISGTATPIPPPTYERRRPLAVADNVVLRVVHPVDRHPVCVVDAPPRCSVSTSIFSIRNRIRSHHARRTPR